MKIVLNKSELEDAIEIYVKKHLEFVPSNIEVCIPPKMDVASIEILTNDSI